MKNIESEGKEERAKGEDGEQMSRAKAEVTLTLKEKNNKKSLVIDETHRRFH